MEKRLTDSEISDALSRFSEYIKKYVPPYGGDRDDFISEILVQGFFELTKRVNVENAFQHLMICFPNLCKRARTELSKVSKVMKGNVEIASIDFIEPPRCTFRVDAEILFREYIDELRGMLTITQLKVLDWVLENPDAPKAQAMEELGYASEAGYRQILYRIIEKIGKL